MNLLHKQRTERVLATPLPVLTTMRLERIMAVLYSKPRPPARKTEALYEVWCGIRGRVLNPNNAAYANYGGRGIALAAEWEDYPVFRSWALAHGYSRGLSIDRIDNDGPYSPGNCRWVDRKTQNRNTRKNHLITYKGKTASIAEHAEDAGLKYCCVHQRIFMHGWSIERALSTPVLKTWSRKKADA